MVQIASVIEEAMMFFGSPYPRDQDRRIKVLGDYADENDPDWNPFESLYDRFYDLINEEADGFYSAADAFAAEEIG